MTIKNHIIQTRENKMNINIELQKAILEHDDKRFKVVIDEDNCLLRETLAYMNRQVLIRWTECVYLRNAHFKVYNKELAIKPIELDVCEINIMDQFYVVTKAEKDVFNYPDTEELYEALLGSEADYIREIVKERFPNIKLALGMFRLVISEMELYYKASVTAFKLSSEENKDSLDSLRK